MATNLAPASASHQPPAQNVTALRRVFETIDANSCPRSFNFHMHTVCSDGKLQPEDLIQQAKSIGLKGLAITDHHSIKGYQAVERWLDQQALGSGDQDKSRSPHLWTGVEIT